MQIAWHEDAWNDYVWWQSQNKKTLKRINSLIKDMQRTPFDGIGKPEPLRYRDGWSRRIDDKNRLLYQIIGETILITSSRGH